MISYKPKDIIVAPFPFTETHKTKPRPLLVISTKAYNGLHHHVFALMITTASKTTWPSDTPIVDYIACGLPVASFVRMKYFTLDTRVIKKHIGHMHAPDWAMIQQKLCEILAL